MTIPEAVALVIQAGAIGGRGRILVLDMGEPIRILDLARNMIRLSGKEPERDVADHVHRRAARARSCTRSCSPRARPGSRRRTRRSSRSTSPRSTAAGSTSELDELERARRGGRHARARRPPARRSCGSRSAVEAGDGRGGRRRDARLRIRSSSLRAGDPQQAELAALTLVREVCRARSSSTISVPAWTSTRNKSGAERRSRRRRCRSTPTRRAPTGGSLRLVDPGDDLGVLSGGDVVAPDPRRRRSPWLWPPGSSWTKMLFGRRLDVVELVDRRRRCCSRRASASIRIESRRPSSGRRVEHEPEQTPVRPRSACRRRPAHQPAGRRVRSARGSPVSAK